ncbi:hypothetical protein E2562_018445 [Oryza meyeriana var. granulata]|uniref:Uncharacterized protein n=1 Tax=Oryza meyeriana var. granulata TaxID=110450 RepID=A0A6G1EME0_9ORYZ|nr:hypothetical protein E2562_018445 [Oryza meyeriana var. granulata]
MRWPLCGAFKLTDHRAGVQAKAIGAPPHAVQASKQAGTALGRCINVSSSPLSSPPIVLAAVLSVSTSSSSPPSLQPAVPAATVAYLPPYRHLPSRWRRSSCWCIRAACYPCRG